MPATIPVPPGKPKPPAPRRRTGLLLTMILAVLTAVALTVFVLRLARQPGGKVNLGDQEFALGKDTVFAAQIQSLGRPLLFAPLRGQITLFVQHLGSDPAQHWLAFAAQAPGQPARCLVTWRPATRDLVDCRGSVYPADGTGLEHYPVRVDQSGQVIINLRTSIGTTPPTDPATTTTRATTKAPTSTTATPAPGP